MTATTTSATVEHDDYPGRLLMEARAEIERLRAPPTKAEVEAASAAYQAHFERFVICCRSASGNMPESVVDEETGETVFGPALGAREWNYLQGTRAALEAAAKVRKK